MQIYSNIVAFLIICGINLYHSEANYEKAVFLRKEKSANAKHWHNICYIC